MASLDLSASAAIERFQRYLRCRTVHPDPTPGYEEAAVLLKEVGEAVGLEYHRLDIIEGHPIIYLKWEGRSPELPSIILNSHLDVVPVDADKWTVDPWGGELIDGKIYGRGTQDMKSVGSQYLEAVARLKASGYTPVRTVYLLYVPDEEVGGTRGMKALLGHAIVKSLNPALALDEGLASPTDSFSVFYGERKIWWLHVKAEGPAGHGSRFIDGTAVSKLLGVANKVMDFRASEQAALAANCACGKQLGDYTTMNLTMLHAGDHSRYQYNCIPTSAEAGFDCRIPCTVDLAAFKAKVDGWCSAEPGVSWKLVNSTDHGALEHSASDISPDAFWWGRFQAACAAAGAPLLEPSIFPAATDSRWVRMMLGIPCFGFSPMRRLPILLHDHDEYVSVEAFLEGIDIYEKLIPVLADTLGAPEGVLKAAAASVVAEGTAAAAAAPGGVEAGVAGAGAAPASS